MAPQETIEKARNVVEELPRRGETGQAEVIEAILAEMTNSATNFKTNSR